MNFRFLFGMCACTCPLETESHVAQAGPKQAEDTLKLLVLLISFSQMLSNCELYHHFCFYEVLGIEHRTGQCWASTYQLTTTPELFFFFFF